jgi:hypothetical protein
VIEFSDAFVTVNAAVPETLPDVAVIVVFPAASALATPFVPDVLLIVATAGDDELQVTELVRFCVLPSLKVPFATNCAVVLGAIDGVEVVTAIEFKVAAETVKIVVSETPPTLAVIVVVPAVNAEAKPDGTIVATAVEEDVHDVT